MTLQFILSQKQKKLLVTPNKYVYQQHHVNKKSIVWRCIEYSKIKCTAVCHTTNDKTTGEWHTNKYLIIYY